MFLYKFRQWTLKNDRIGSQKTSKKGLIIAILIRISRHKVMRLQGKGAVSPL
jgi:N-acyl-L-homoserine lactone synthetase